MTDTPDITNDDDITSDDIDEVIMDIRRSPGRPMTVKREVRKVKLKLDECPRCGSTAFFGIGENPHLCPDCHETGKVESVQGNLTVCTGTVSLVSEPLGLSEYPECYSHFGNCTLVGAESCPHRLSCSLVSGGTLSKIAIGFAAISGGLAAYQLYRMMGRR